jgi:RNA polymerase sigma factor (sigma-70 family)
MSLLMSAATIFLSDSASRRRYTFKSMTSDLDLLGQFAREKSQNAFTALVKRHVNLVYSAALRQVRSPQLAEEIAQSVFADLARNAGSLARGGAVSSPKTLTPWLYAVTRRTAIDVIRKESRRQLREQIATEMNAMNADAQSSAGVPPAWFEIEPLLDEAVSALDETDRSAILLRYFENKSLREVGEALGTNDDTAQKRVSRAVERLREFFSKRNVTIGASGLAVVISTNAVQAAPIGLAATISTTAILAGATIQTSTAITATKAIAMTTLQKTVITAALAAAVGTGIFEAHQTTQLREENQTLQQQQAPVAERLRQLQADNQTLSNRLMEIDESQKLSDDQYNELLKLRGELGALQNKNEDENLKLRQKISQLEGMWINWTNGAHFVNPFFSRDEWSERGTDEPINALQALLWAIRQNDEAKLAQLVFRTNDSQSIESLILPKRMWDNVTGVQIVDVHVISDGSAQRKAIIGTILEKETGNLGASPGTSSDNPVLDQYIHTENIIRRWFLEESNGQWFITGSG